jgi:hypothetical protein
MVQPKYSPEEALERVKLMMKYDLSKTSTENKKVVSEQVLLAPGFEDPNQQKDLRRGDSPVKDYLKNQQIGKSACRKYIQDHYTAWKQRKVIPSNNQVALKNAVQNCAYQHYNKFGIGGEKFDEMIDVLSGDSRKEVGPNKHGKDGMWKIESPNRN